MWNEKSPFHAAVTNISVQGPVASHAGVFRGARISSLLWKRLRGRLLLVRPSSIWLRVFFSGCGFEFSWFFSRQRWKRFPSATYAKHIDRRMLIMIANNLLTRRLQTKLKYQKVELQIYKTTHLSKNIKNYCNKHLILRRGLFAKAAFLKLN